MDDTYWRNIKEKWVAGCTRIGFGGEDNPEILLEIVSEIPHENKQQFIEEIVNGFDVYAELGTGLHVAADRGRLKCVKHLVEELNADVNVRDWVGRTPLHWAARDDNVTVVKYLVDKCGADVNAVDEWGWTPLHFAAENDAEIVVSYLSLYCDIKIESKQENEGISSESTALEVAEMLEYCDALQCLKFVTATSVEDLIGPPANTAKFYLIMRCLKVGGFTIEKLSVPLDMLSCRSCLPT